MTRAYIGIDTPRASIRAEEVLSADGVRDEGAVMRLWDATWMQIEQYLERDDRVLVPLGSTEQHGYLSLGVDALICERGAIEAAEPEGVPVLPVMPFGLTPGFTHSQGRSTSARRPTWRSCATCSTRSRARACSGSCW
jgi:creatinine amidohydrolase/Fe(II)-dependent formamide hydrolase-like protein